MKKLLGLLGAIGLVATSSATVVACGPSPEEKDTTMEVAFEKDLAGLKAEIADKLNEGVTDETAKVSVDNLYVTADQANLDSHIAYLNKTTDDTTTNDGTEVSELVAGTSYVWAEVTPAVAANPDADPAVEAIPASIKQQGNVKMAEEVTVTDLSTLTLTAPAVATTLDAFKTSFQTELNGLVDGVAVDTDYTITPTIANQDGSTFAAGDTVKISSVQGSALLTGEITLTVAGEETTTTDLSTLTLTAPAVATTLDAFKTSFQTELNGLVGGVAVDTDYTITPTIANADGVTFAAGDTVKISSVQGSALLTGEITLTVVA